MATCTVFVAAATRRSLPRSDVRTCLTRDNLGSQLLSLPVALPLCFHVQQPQRYREPTAWQLS